MAAIPDDKVQDVRDRVDIVDLIGRYVELKRAGRNYKGLCPFHAEKTPSFNVNPDRKGYKCFGCGAGGDAIAFVMDIEGKSFPEAVRKLAEMYGVSLPAETAGSGARRRDRTERDLAYAILRLATELYEAILADAPEGAAGRAYVEQRGIEREIARTFRLGYAPAPGEAGWDRLTRAIETSGLPLELAETLGLVSRSERSGRPFDRFRGRLMFPLLAPGGDPVAFSGRIVPPHDAAEDDRPPPKYVNSPESFLFTKGKMLFGLPTARPKIHATRRAILVEGNIDVIKLHQWGHAEAVAPLGTALTPEQARLLARFAEQVVMCFDGDAAGKKAAWAALPLLLEADLDVRMVLLPSGEDPDSIGRERLGALLAHPKPALEEMMVRIAARAGEAAHARASGFDRVVPLIAKVPRETARALYADRAAELFGFPSGRVRAALRAALASAPERPSRRAEAENSRRFHSISGPPVPPSAPVPSLPSLPAEQAQLAMLLVDLPHLASLAERSGVRACVTDPRLAPIVAAVLDGAQHGREATMPELLDLVDPRYQAEVHDAVFRGSFRGDGSSTVDPQAILHGLLHRCRERALEQRIRELDVRIRQAKDAGYPDEAVALAQQRLELRRRQAALRQPELSGDAPTDNPSARN